MRNITLTLLILGSATFLQAQTDTTQTLYTSLKEAVESPLSVYKLKVSDLEDIKRLPELSKLKNLEYLSLKGDRLTVFPREIVNLKKLKVLDLSENEFTTLP
jgi:Leucine-rich repeat (LRR) protein